MPLAFAGLQALQLAYLPLIYLGLHARGPGVRIACSVLLMTVALWAWTRSLRRARALADTPTARVATAAQGYVELAGRLKPFAQELLRAPGTGRPCVWYRTHTEERVGDRWNTVSRVQSVESLLLADDSGECVVLWDGAEILTPHQEISYDDPLRTTARWLADGDQVTVLGELQTRGGAAVLLSVDAEVRELLADWKADRASLLARFDHDGDGQISQEEWEDARVAARHEVETRRSAAPVEADTHILRKPGDGRPFIVSAMPARALAWHLGWLAALDLAVFFAGLAGLGVTLRLV